MCLYRTMDQELQTNELWDFSTKQSFRHMTKWAKVYLGTGDQGVTRINHFQLKRNLMPNTFFPSSEIYYKRIPSTSIMLMDGEVLSKIVLDQMSWKFLWSVIYDFMRNMFFFKFLFIIITINCISKAIQGNAFNVCASYSAFLYISTWQALQSF